MRKILSGYHYSIVYPFADSPSMRHTGYFVENLFHQGGLAIIFIRIKLWERKMKAGLSREVFIRLNKQQKPNAKMAAASKKLEENKLNQSENLISTIKDKKNER